MRQKIGTSIKFTNRTKLAFFSGSFLLIFYLLFLNFYLSKTPKAFSAIAGDYRSITSGNWNSASTWVEYNGSNWVAATSAPATGSGTVEIDSGHTVTVTANATIDQLVIKNGGQIIINSSIALILANGAGYDLSVSGTMRNAGSITRNTGSTIEFQSGGVYDHNQDAGDIPIALWNTGSTCMITGVVDTRPDNIDQSFYNFTYNCPNQTSVENTQDNFTTVNGNFTMISTGTGALRFGPSNLFTINIGGNFSQQGGSIALCGSNSPIYNISGNFTISGGSLIFTDVTNSSGNGTPIMNVTGDFNISGGTIDMTQFTSNTSGKGIGTLNLNGNFTQTGGTLTETANTLAASGYGTIYFVKSGTQIFSKTGGAISNTIDFTVNAGSILDMGTSYPTGSGDFTVLGGGALILASPDGITSSGAIGNVQVTGTRSFSTTANYTYDAISSQVTGNGLPSTVNNFTINNSSHVTLTNTVSVSGILTLFNGQLITGVKELIVTNSATSGINGHSSTNYVRGNLRRYVNTSGSYDFPVGTPSYYEYFNVNLSGSTGVTNILGYFTNANPINPTYPITGITIFGTEVDTMLDYGYWTVTPNSTMTSGNYSITLKQKGYSNSAGQASSYCVLKREDINYSWQSIGTHNSNTQSEVNGVCTAVRSALTSFSHFGIGRNSGVGGLPITLVNFIAEYKDNMVMLSWETASETNNAYFTVERSPDGINFLPVLTREGAGNSTINNYYSGNDTEPLEGTSYYRLKQTDYDGNFTYSDLKSVTNDRKKISVSFLELISVYPNPFSDHFDFLFRSQVASIANFKLLNSEGKVVFDSQVNMLNGENQYQFKEESELPTGIYYAVLSFHDKKIVHKILKK